MIRFTSEDGVLVCEAQASGRFSVFLDNDSLITLAQTKDAALRSCGCEKGRSAQSAGR